MSGKVKLENTDIYVNEKVKNKEFTKRYKLELPRVALAQRIAEIRQQRRMRQTDLAKKMHVCQQFISQSETGQQTNLTLVHAGQASRVAPARGRPALPLRQHRLEGSGPAGDEAHGDFLWSGR